MDKALNVDEETTTCGVTCVCVLVHKREREEVKNESVAEQSQYRGNLELNSHSTRGQNYYR